jgi:hypothetical protein
LVSCWKGSSSPSVSSPKTICLFKRLLLAPIFNTSLSKLSSNPHLCVLRGDLIELNVSMSRKSIACLSCLGKLCFVKTKPQVNTGTLILFLVAELLRCLTGSPNILCSAKGQGRATARVNHAAACASVAYMRICFLCFVQRPVFYLFEINQCL